MDFYQTMAMGLTFVTSAVYPIAKFIVIIIVPLSHYEGSAQHVYFFHSLLSLVISILSPFVLMLPFTQSAIHLFLGRKLHIHVIFSFL
jgi:hypothetical protein